MVLPTGRITCRQQLLLLLLLPTTLKFPLLRQRLCRRHLLKQPPQLLKNPHFILQLRGPLRPLLLARVHLRRLLLLLLLPPPPPTPPPQPQRHQRSHRRMLRRKKNPKKTLRRLGRIATFAWT